jgi:hypothetical protein
LGDKRLEEAMQSVEWVTWFNHDRLHSSIGDVPPVEFEQDYAERVEAEAPLEQDQPLPSSVRLQDTEAT